MTSRPNSLRKARKRRGLWSCPVCGSRRSNMRRHSIQHPEWDLHRYSSGWYATRVIMRSTHGILEPVEPAFSEYMSARSA